MAIFVPQSKERSHSQTHQLEALAHEEEATFRRKLCPARTLVPPPEAYPKAPGYHTVIVPAAPNASRGTGMAGLAQTPRSFDELLYRTESGRAPAAIPDPDVVGSGEVVATVYPAASEGSGTPPGPKSPSPRSQETNPKAQDPEDKPHRSDPYSRSYLPPFAEVQDITTHNKLHHSYATSGVFCIPLPVFAICSVKGIHVDDDDEGKK
ncbi:hypothetical protein V8F06_008274 [Rhypophila decipiens]